MSEQAVNVLSIDEIKSQIKGYDQKLEDLRRSL